MKLEPYETRNYKCDKCGAVEKHIDMHDEELCYVCYEELSE